MYQDVRGQESGRSLAPLCIQYVRSRRDKGELTQGTGEQYLSRLLRFADAVNLAPGRVRRRHIERWLEEPGLSAHYRRARLSAVRGFFQWCVIQGHVERDPTAGVRMPKLPPLLPRYLTPDESEAAVEACDDPRARLAAILMLQEGLRRGEVARIQLGDIDRRKRILAVRGKGGGGEVTRRLPLVDEAWRALNAFLPSVPGASGPLFRSTRYPDRGLSGAWIGELVTRAMKDAGVKRYAWDGRSPHALRHTCAQDLVDADVDVRLVQKALGHASIRNTELYLRGAVQGLTEAMEGRRYYRPGE